jgi:hypothetical protein
MSPCFRPAALIEEEHLLNVAARVLTDLHSAAEYLVIRSRDAAFPGQLRGLIHIVHRRAGPTPAPLDTRANLTHVAAGPQRGAADIRRCFHGTFRVILRTQHFYDR